MNEIPKKTIEKFRKAQEESLEYYKPNFKSNGHQMKNIEELRTQIFKEKFYFQILYKPEDQTFSKKWVFNIFTFVTDFYISPTEIDLLE